MHLQVTLKAASFLICPLMMMSSRKNQYCEVSYQCSYKINVCILVASILYICHTSDIIVWVEVNEIGMWLG
jgi:hypothetical protein